MTQEEILKLANEIYPRVRDYYGEGRKSYPPIEVHRNIYARLSGEPDMEGDDPAEAEFDRKENKLFLYSDYIDGIEDIARGIIHEYVHFLQSESWMRRYYKMGHTYQTHPYEIKASEEEKNWKKFV